MNAFGLLIEPTDELGLFMREVLMKHLDFTVRLPRPDLFTTAFDSAYEARQREFPNFGAGAGMTSEEWWAPVFYKAFLDLDMPKEDVDEVFIGVFEELYYDALPSEWAWEPVEDVLPVRACLSVSGVMGWLGAGLGWGVVVGGVGWGGWVISWFGHID